MTRLIPKKTKLDRKLSVRASDKELRAWAKLAGDRGLFSVGEWLRGLANAELEKLAKLDG
jgi:hypothetical protein